MKQIREAAREIPVIREVDVCVVGGGCTGVFAAVRAARLGASVAIIEQDNCFGGVGTSGLVNVWHRLTDMDDHKQIIAGLTQEMLDRLSHFGAVSENDNKDDLARFHLNTEELKIELDKIVQEAGVYPYFHTMYCAPFVEDGMIKAVVIENKNGRQAIKARFFIDASGDGDLARDLELEHLVFDQIQPPSPCYKIAGNLAGIPVSALVSKHGREFGLQEDWGWSGEIPGAPGLYFRADTHVFHLDCANADDMTRAEIEGRMQIRAVMDILRKYAPGGEKLALASVCSHLGVRETRHYQSVFRIDGEGLLYGRAYDDAIAYGTYPVDMHHSDDAGITFRFLNGTEHVHHDRVSPPTVQKWRTDGEYARFYQIPFRALVQDKYPNFIAAGRMINADAQAYGAIRVMVNLNQIGEAAGTAAALCLQENVPVNKLRSDKLRRTLKAGGSIIL